MKADVIDVRAVPKWGGVGRAGRILRLWPWLPLPLGAAYLLLIVAKFNQIVAALYLNADYASAPVIGQLFGGAPAHRTVVLGQVGWFSTLMFELATRWLPGHRQLWEAAPYAMALASVVLISWGAWKVAGRWAAAITGVLLLCAGPETLSLLFALNDHSSTWFSVALLAAALVLFEVRPSWLRTWLAVLVALSVGAVVGANTASDLLMPLAGIAPIVIAVGLAWALRPSRASASACWWVLGTVAVAGVVDELTRRLMTHENVVAATGFPHNILASGEALSANFKLWWQSVMVLGNGNFFGQVLGLTTALELICALMALAAVALIPWLVWRELAATFPRKDGRPEAPLSSSLRIAWCVFWGSSAVLLSVGYVFTTNPVGLTSDRYLVGVIYAAAALVPLMVGRRVVARAAVVAGASVFALAGIVSLLDGQVLSTGGTSSYSLYNQVARVAARAHLSIGYADYWDAAPLMWASHFRVRAYPVNACGSGGLCPFPLHSISSWYQPLPHQRTFLISNPTKPANVSPAPNLGKPSAVYHIGVLTMYVYPYDIASRMMP